MKRTSFGKRAPFAQRPSAAALTDRIVVTQSVFDSGDPVKFVQQVVEFVNALFDRGAYLREEIPANALRSYHTDYYLAQVCNGGHTQFVANGQWVPQVVRDVREGLALMGLEAYAQIFADLCAFIDDDRETVKRLSEMLWSEAKEPVLEALDKRFFALHRNDDFTPAHARWLRSLPELEVVADADHARRLQALYDANPQRAARQAAARREALTRGLEDPLRVAARLLCMRAGCLPVAGVGGGSLNDLAPDGRRGTGWRIQSAGGRQVMFLFDDVALLCESYLPDGRRITNDLLADQQKQLMAGDLSALDGYSGVRNKEIARIPAAEIADAVEAARTTPLLTIATLFCRELESGETVRDLFAAGVQGSGRWVWVMETDRRACLFSASGYEYVLTDMEMKPLARLSLADIQAAAAAEMKGRA